MFFSYIYCYVFISVRKTGEYATNYMTNFCIKTGVIFKSGPQNEIKLITEA